MDGQDWSEFQQELEDNLIPDAMFYRDVYNYIPVQHLCKIDDSPQNLFPISEEAALWNTNTNAGLESINPTINNEICMKRKRDDDFRGVSQNPKRPFLDKKKPTNINFSSAAAEPDVEAIADMKEIIYQAAAFRPVDFGDGETERRAKRKNVRISSDPQTVAARERRERISERIRALQRLVPGGSKMDTASMLDEAANYLKFLRSQVKALEALGGQGPNYEDLGFGYSAMQVSGFSVQGPNPVGKPESC